MIRSLELLPGYAAGMVRQRGERVVALVGSASFLVVAPGTVALYVPWAMTRWRLPEPRPSFWIGGAVLVIVGSVGLLDSFRRFAVEGLGTPAPIYPTRTLVATGLYRHVRNPMYCGVLATILGQALVFHSGEVFLYGLAVAIAFHLFVLLYEEPRLLATYGESYEAFRRGVPRWIPRARPWRQESHRP